MNAAAISKLRCDLEALGETERDRAAEWVQGVNRCTDREADAYRAGFEQGWGKLLVTLVERRLIGK